MNFKCFYFDTEQSMWHFIMSHWDAVFNVVYSSETDPGEPAECWCVRVLHPEDRKKT